MIILGLTGSIAMGKTTVAKQFETCGVPISNSDAIVYALLSENGEAVEAVSRLFPAARKSNHIDRKLLGAEVFGDTTKMKQLEAILHPLVRKAEDKFIRQARVRGDKIVVLDIPLLFETHREKRCDYTVVVTAPYFLQKHRALTRRHMTEARFNSILALQMKNSEKIKRADFVVFTGLGRYNSLKMVKEILAKVTGTFEERNE